MPPITILTRETSEKIAAGEVVERPMSVVKELVENAIDAGSTRITVDIAEGGHKHIIVSDNGCGMSNDELQLAIQRFATSKITQFDDLEEIKTLGFRGEALPSIGAVSHLEILSCPEGALSGHRIRVEGGLQAELTEAAAEQGTIVKVGRLFFNTPARKKFQKSPSQETALISHYLSGCAAAHRHIHFTLKSGSRVLFNYPCQLSRKDCLRHIWGLSEEALLPFEAEMENMSVEGFAVSPEHSRNNRTELIVYINGRSVKSPLIYQAVQEGYHPFLAPRRFPHVFLSLTIDGREIDVNVHPSKTEVRFVRSGAVFRLVRDALAAVVNTFKPDLAPLETATHLEAPITQGYMPQQHFHRPTIKEGEVAAALLLYNPATGEVTERARGHEVRSYEPAWAPAAKEPSLTGFMPLAQLYDTYIVGEQGGELWLLDQHASHERIVYERLLSRKSETNPGAQGLLFPEVLELTPSEAHLMNDLLGPCRDMGLEIEPFGGSTFQIRSLPSFLKTEDAKTLITQIISDLMEENISTPDDRIDRLRKIMACRGSIQAGDRLMPQEMERLVSDLLKAQDPYHCPHGRPTVIKMGKLELEKIFKRK
jgi:DNA mismatch repair protein MutL